MTVKSVIISQGMNEIVKLGISSILSKLSRRRMLILEAFSIGKKKLARSSKLDKYQRKLVRLSASNPK